MLIEVFGLRVLMRACITWFVSVAHLWFASNGEGSGIGMPSFSDSRGMSLMRSISAGEIRKEVYHAHHKRSMMARCMP